MSCLKNTWSQIPILITQGMKSILVIHKCCERHQHSSLQWQRNMLKRNCNEYPETTHLSSFSLASLKAPQWSLDIANVERPSPPLTGAQTQQYCYNNHFLMMSTRIYKIFIVTYCNLNFHDIYWFNISLNNCQCCISNPPVKKLNIQCSK